MDSGSTHLHVVPGLDGGWTVRESADGPALRRTPTRRGVLAQATLLLARRAGGRVTVHAVDGTVTERFAVRALGKRRWWYQPPGWLPLVAPLLIIVTSLRSVLSGSSAPVRWLGVLALVCALLGVGCVVLSRWDDRRRGPLAAQLRSVDD